LKAEPQLQHWRDGDLVQRLDTPFEPTRGKRCFRTTFPEGW
jgi:hypothetical protein